MNGAETVQWAKLIVAYVAFASAFAELWMWGQGRRWRRVQCAVFYAMAFCCGFLGVALL